MSAQEREALVRLVWDDETTYAEAADLADKIIAAGWSRPVPAAGEAATEDVVKAEALREARSPALPHARTPAGGAVMTIHNVRLFWSGYVLTVLNSMVLGACLERMLR